MMDFRNLLRTIRLFIPFVFLGLGVGVFFSLHSFFTALIVPLIVVLQGSWQESSGFATVFFLLFLIAGLLLLIITFLLYIFILTVYSRLLKLFWSSPPKIFCLPKNFKNRSYHFLIASIANIPIVLIFNICLFLASGFSTKKYVKNLMYKSLYETYGYTPDYYSFSDNLASKSHNISMIEVLGNQGTGYGVLMFLFFSYLLYFLSDKYLKKNKKAEAKTSD